MALVLLLSACSSARHAAPLTFVVVRHAEKVSSSTIEMSASGNSMTASNNDPELTAEGVQRAANLALMLKQQPVVAVYATAFKRTQATAAPTAAQYGLSVVRYDAKQPTSEFIESLRGRHSSGTVLVVGHSNTVPAMVSALCACQAPALSDSDYGDRFVVRFKPDGSSVLERARF